MSKFHINRFIIFLISSNVFAQASLGLVVPVLAVFVVEIPGATVATAGIAAGLYWIVKAFVQLFVGWYLDKNEGEKDDYISLVLGLSIYGIVPFLYLLVDSVLSLYIVQILLSFGGAFSVPPWFAMFSRHLDDHEENIEWSLNSSISFGIGAGVSGIAGGWIVKAYGFSTLFIAAGVFGIISAIVLIPLYHNLRKRVPAKENKDNQDSLDVGTVLAEPE